MSEQPQTSILRQPEPILNPSSTAPHPPPQIIYTKINTNQHENPQFPLLLRNDVPTTLNCPNCKKRITTIVSYETGLFTYLAAGGVCFFCCCLAVIPCLMDTFKDAFHHCPKCNMMIGVYKRIR